MTWLKLTSLLVFSFGALAYGAILLAWLRQVRRKPLTSQELVGGVMSAFCCCWFIVNVLLVLLHLRPAVKPWTLQSVHLLLTCLFPGLIMHVLYVETPRESARRRFLRAGVWVVYLVGLIVSLSALAVFWGFLPFPQRATSMTVGLTAGLLFLCAALYGVLALSGRQPGDAAAAPEGRFRGWMRLLFGLLGLLALILILAHAGWIEIGELVSLVTQSIPLGFLFVGTYYENRFEFFDVFVKRAAYLLLTVALLTAAFALILPWLEGLELAWARPWVYAVALLPIVLFLPAAYRRLGSWLDNRWLGRRFSPEQALRHFLHSIQRATGERELAEQAGRSLEAIFQARARIDLGPVAVAGSSPDTDWVQRMPLRSGLERLGEIQLSARANDHPYFSQDVALLESLGEVFVSMLEHVRLQHRKQEQEQRVQELSLQASRSELKALRAQINPHFLFNALNAIAGLIHNDPRRADRTIEQLAEVFRYTLQRSEKEWATLEEELAFVRSYLEVEQARFGERLRFRIEVDRGLPALRVPAMIVQTLVENAVKHGLAVMRGPGQIEIDVTRRAQRLIIEVKDNGPGFDDEPSRPRRTSGNGFGLSSVRRRLAGYFGEAAALSVSRIEDQGWTVVCISLPLAQVEGAAGS